MTRSGGASRLVAAAVVMSLVAVGCGSSKSSGSVSSGPDQTSAGEPGLEQAAATPGTLDGTYTLTSTKTCGADQVKTTESETLTVASGQATIALPPAGIFEGPIVVNGGTFSFDVTLPDQYTHAHLEGTIAGNGDVITGTGTSGQGTLMSTCDMTFTGHRGTGATGAATTTTPGSSGTTDTTPAGTRLPTAADCTIEVMQSYIDAHGGSAKVTESPRCVGLWAEGSATIGEGEDQVDVAYLYKWDGQAWGTAYSMDVCTNGELPPGINCAS